MPLQSDQANAQLLRCLPRRIGSLHDTDLYHDALAQSILLWYKKAGRRGYLAGKGFVKRRSRKTVPIASIELLAYGGTKAQPHSSKSLFESPRKYTPAVLPMIGLSAVDIPTLRAAKTPVILETKRSYKLGVFAKASRRVAKTKPWLAPQESIKARYTTLVEKDRKFRIFSRFMISILASLMNRHSTA